MASSSKRRPAGLKTENSKLEQDIADMESALHQQKARLINDSSIRKQISKASGNSTWLSGAKGQLSGYRSHKELPGNRGMSDRESRESAKAFITRSKSAGVQTGRRGRTQSFTSVSETRGALATKDTVRSDTPDAADKTSGSREPVKGNNNRVRSAPVRRGYTTKADRQAQHARALSLQGGMKVNALHQSQKMSRNERVPQTGKLSKNGERRVSFDLSDEDDSRATSASSRDPVFDQGEPIIKATRSAAGGGAKTPETGSYADRIAHLKARVIAKASANLKPEVLSTLGRERQNGSDDVLSSRTSTNRTGRRDLNSHRAPTANQGVLPDRLRGGKTNPAAQKNKASASKDQRLVKQGRIVQRPDYAKTARCSPKEENTFDGDADLYFDASVELWLCSLNLADSLECVKIFRRGRVTMESLPSLTEVHLIQMGVTAEDTLSKILQGIRKLHQDQKSPGMSDDSRGGNLRTSGHHEEGMLQTTKLSDLMDGDRFEEVLTLKDSSPPASSRSPEIPSSSWVREAHHVDAEQSHRPITAETSHRTKQADKAEDSSEGATSPESLRKNADSKIQTERSKGAKTNPKKRGKALSADVVNRTLTSGVQSAMTKLKQKQEQELHQQKRQDRLRRAQKAERDKLALQHARRQQEKLEQMLAEEGEDREGGAEDDWRELGEASSSPEASGTFRLQDGIGEGLAAQSQDVIKMSIQGGGLLGKIYPSSPSDGDDAAVPDSSEPLLSPKLTAEDRLKHLELNIQGLQDSESPATAASEVERLQQQLASLKRDLATAHAAVSVSAEPGRASVRAPSAGKSSSSGPSRAVYSSMSKNELMREVRKQKEQHRKQIRLLESELSRLKHRDPVRNCELPENDILYRQEDLIGEGTFSQVFRGYFNGSEVAIKRLKNPLDSADHNYFAEEVTLLHELRHPRVILLLGVCTSGRRPLMVLEYMAGGSLYDRLHDKSRESLDHVAYYQVARDVALGMNYLHRHKPQVLHLDLKSMNVLLGLHGRAKIGDFGFAKLRHEAQTVEKGKVQGTPAWMAPELMINTANSLTDKVDVYSFGIIMWEMLTGLQPYKGLSVFQVLEAVQQKKRPDIPESCSQPLSRLIRVCWEHKPNKRPSFKDILIALEALVLPPEWRSLLTAANIPREAMEDPVSARSVIAVVNGSVGLTQRELDELALAYHEGALDIGIATGGEGSASQAGTRAAEKPLGSITGAIAQHIPYDSLNEDGNAAIQPGFEYHACIQLQGLQGDDPDDEAAASPGSPRGCKERSPRPARGKSPRVSSPSRRGIPVPPPIHPTMLAGLPGRRPQPTPAPAAPHPRGGLAPGGIASRAPPAGHRSMDPSALLEQRKHLRTTQAGPHPSQLPSLSEIGEPRMTSIAEILKKAVAARRAALREEGHSLEQSLPESLWSAATDDD